MTSSLTDYLPVRFLTSRRVLLLLTTTVTVVLLLLIQHVSHDGPSLSPASQLQTIPENSRELTGSSSSSQRMREAERDFTQRLAQYDSVCKSRVPGTVGEVYYHQQSNLSVCHVPRTGCTFWKKIFHFLYNETGSNRTVRSPFEIARYDVHLLPKKRVKILHYDNWHFKDKALMDGTHKVLFVRDPYARLWSVYLDKFFLIDSWLDHGMAIVRRRKVEAKKRRRCANDLTFEEYLRYVVTANLEPHWLPIHRVCNPCVFHPDIVGKTETFVRDSTYILKQAGLEHLLQGYDHRFYVREEMRMLTDYHFRVYEDRQGLRACLTHFDLAARLWQVFLFSGYIGHNVTFPEKQFSEELDSVGTREACEIAKKRFLEAHRVSPVLSPHRMQAHRRQAMVEHYRQVPAELLQSVVDIYGTDFALFGYDSKPKDIFHPVVWKENK